MIYRRIRSERVAQGVTLEELSKRTGIAASNLSRLERGRVDARASTLIRVLRALGMSLTVTPTPVMALDDIKARMAVGAARLSDFGVDERDADARIDWKERRGLDTKVERRLLGSD
jgi:transcriptional regulator with XRE-family HTH domain